MRCRRQTAILAGLACFLVPAYEEDSVVRSGRDSDGHQQVDDVGGEADDAVQTE
jgi:hypothetical protein